MGDIADDIIDGTCCALCGQYFIDPKKKNFAYTHGYPVACLECWDKKCEYPKADVETF